MLIVRSNWNRKQQLNCRIYLSKCFEIKFGFTAILINLINRNLISNNHHNTV
jgi:hypothetical protein